MSIVNEVGRKALCVTGASGFIASWLLSKRVKYSVALTMLYDYPKKTEHLLSLEGAKERLQLFKADLLEEGFFDAVVDRREGVFSHSIAKI
ncbi:hypothetical protein PRUPE_2G020800 [Prunus persica]|uniref:NAD(P)-binding domain-containing protein n=1 Tax=Prunus persica TaxID=3760 RepID=M5X5N1_PRUPE|nr:hypothetical protein PRUPE_2G020800 [Prunus persica]